MVDGDARHEVFGRVGVGEDLLDRTADAALEEHHGRGCTGNREEVTAPQLALFNKLRGDLRIKPLNVGFAAYYESVGRVDLMENHKDEKPVFISGKQVRQWLVNGEPVDPRIMRESTARILTEAMAAG